MPSTNFELFNETTSSVQRNVKLKDKTSFFMFFFRSPARSELHKGISRWEEISGTNMNADCLQNASKYVLDQ